MNKRIVGVFVGGVLVAAAAFAGGYFASSRMTAASDPRGAFSRLSDSERQQMAAMTDEERQAFMKDKGIELPTGGRMGVGAMGAGGPGGTQVLEGTVDGVAEDKVSLTLTAGGSAKFYTDDSTVLAAVAEREAKVAEGATVVAVVKPEAAGVNAAQLVVVK